MIRVALAILSAVLLAATVSARERTFAACAAVQTQEDVYYLPADEGVLAILTLGYREAAADLLWMRALLYYAQSLRHSTEATYALNYASALSSLDPHFAPIYHWAGMMPFYLRVATDASTRSRAVSFMVVGADRLPEDGDLAWDTASTILYELLPTFEGSEAEREAWRRTAARLSERAIRLGAGPPWLALDAGPLLARLGESDRAVRVLEQQIALARSADERMALNARLQRLRAGAEATLAEAEARRNEASRMREYPYLDLDQYLALGARRMPTEASWAAP